MRLFLAARPDPNQLADLEQAQLVLGRSSEKISLTKAGNLHLTLHFLGEWQAGDTDRLISALRDFKAPPAEKLRSQLSGYGFFRRKDGHLIYADLTVSPQVLQVQKDLGEVLRTLDFEPDRRRWKAHVTLARRAKLTVPWSELESKLPVQDKSYAFSDLALFKSEFTDQGMLYTPLFIF